MPAVAKAYRVEPYSYEEARALSEELGLSAPVAATLVRRGFRTPESARRFLAADESHPPAAFRTMATAVERLLEAVEAGRQITVHGDFDVDGVCATAIAVAALRELGAECDWLIPDRLADGYGLRAENVERLARRGTSLLLTVDCGVTAVEEVALARRLGVETIVTDHHRPAAELPDCPILHPALDGYPFEELCGTAVAWKLACALREAAGAGAPPEEGLDLVALATVADVVPLVGENRSLARRGLAEARRARRPGLRALIEAAGCDPTRLDEGDLGFRLAPRINAAGRLYRADAGVELFLTEDEGRAARIAAELNRANGERRAAEREVEAAAEAARRELPERLREAPGLVLAGRGWHPGVIGIVASRLVERHHRPVVVVSLDGEGQGRGSGRSIPCFDLLGALRACSEHLVACGGHRAAAGLELREADLEAFREAFASHAAEALGPEDLVRTERIDAMVGGASLGLELAEELGKLAPFGAGNPGVRLLVPSARVRDVRAMGEGRHARFSLHSGGHRALGVAFGKAALGVDAGQPIDATVRLEVNHWNGAVEPRVVLRELYPLPGDRDAGEGVSLHRCGCGDEEWWDRFEDELGRDPGAAPAAAGPAGERQAIVSNASAAAVIAELVSSGAAVLAVCADASRRAGLAAGPAGLARFNGGSARIACGRCGAAAAAALREPGAEGLALTDYDALRRHPGLAERFPHVVLVDPPPSPADELAAGAGGGWLHPVWTAAEHEFALLVMAERLAGRHAVASLYRDLRAAGAAEGARLRSALGGGGAHPRAPETAARCLRVLAELELVHGEPGRAGGLEVVVSSEKADLERSPAFRAYRARYEECQRYIEERRKR